MLVPSLLAILKIYYPVLLPLCLVFWLFYNKYQLGLNKYPGPWLAAYTNWWRFFENLGRRTEWTFINLHRKHGDIVRLGPNVLSFADPRAIKTIYGLNKGFVKSDFYPVQNAVSKGRRLQSLFSTQNEAYHARYRRCVNSAFAMTSMVSYEPLVDSTLDVYLSQTQKLFADTGKSCKFNKWLQYYAFDVIGEITWSKRLGFVEQFEDVDGIIAFIDGFLSYAGPIGQMPILDLLLQKNPISLYCQRLGLSSAVFPATAFAQARSAERDSEMAEIRKNGLKESPTKSQRGTDLLSKFTNAQHENPEFMTDVQVLAATLSMVIAGSETTAISLSAIFYYLLKHPEKQQKLMAELDAAAQDGTIAPRPNLGVSWSESQKLPYLDACIQEAFRLHPAAGLMLERVVPKGGIDICGERVPEGTIVGCNAWVIHRRPEIFGEDVDAYRPERWLEASPEQLREMRGTMFQFGA